MEVRLLGPFEVEHDGRILELRGARQQSVLALLAVHANQPLSVDRMIDELWGEQAPSGAAGTLRSYLSHLRRALEGAPASIERQGPTYVLALDPVAVDARRFEALAETGRHALADGDPVGAAGALSEALTLWRGPALVDFAYEPFAVREAARLDELRLEALEDRIEADLALGRHREVTAELESLVAHHPLREGLCSQLMRALYWSDRRAEALRVYQRGRKLMGEELGLDPGAALQRLEQAILLQDPALSPPRPPTRRRASTGNLPAPLTSFVGRGEELADLARLLDRHRLVTVTGAGGCGKTRLALHAAADVVPAYPGGVWLVELGGLRDPTLVLGTIASALGVREESDQLEDALVEVLSQRPSLLVLDNCEHLLPSTAVLVSALLRSCPDLRVLATSREPLRVEGELAWAAPPLPAPDAARLFAERAATADPAFAANQRDADAIAEICRQLDGLPLAIELAAARLRVLTVSQLAERLRDRFRLLTDGSRDALAHHRTLEAAVEWSYDLLDEDERVLFERLSVFVGGFTLEIAEEVCAGGGLERGDVLELLGSLVDKSLVTRADRTEAEPRYRLLEVLRDFGSRRLEERGTEEVFRRRHAETLTRLAEDGFRAPHGPRWEARLERLDAGNDDARTALEWLLGHGQADQALRLAAAMWRFWDHRHYVTEGRRWLRRALALEGSPRWRLAAQVGSAYLAYADDDFRGAITDCEQGLELAGRLGDRWARAKFLATLGEVARERNDPDGTEAMCEEAAALFSEVGDRWEEAHAMRVLTLVAWDRGDLVRAMELAERCRRLWQGCGDIEGTAGAHALLGGLSRERGDIQRATELYQRSLELFREAGEPWGTAHVVRNLGDLAGARGEHALAYTLGEESLRLHEELGNRRGMAEALRVMGDAALQRGDLDLADRLCTEALKRFRARGFAGDVTAVLPSVARVALARGDLERAAALCEEALGPFRRSGHKRDAAPALCLLGVVRVRQGSPAEASALVEEGLALFREVGDRRGVARGLEALAESALAAGEPERAARYLSEARSTRSEFDLSFTPAERFDHLRVLRAVRNALGDTPFARSWAAEWGDEADVIDLLDRQARLA